VNDVLSDFHPTRTPRLTRRSCPPCHGFTGPPRRATPQSAHETLPLAWADPVRSPWRRCLLPVSATDQLSTSTRRIPRFSSSRLAPFRPSAFSAASSEPAPACGGRDSAVCDGAGRPRERFSRPRVAARLESHRQLRFMATCPRWGGSACPSSGPRRLFWPCVGRDDLCADNPLSYPPVARKHRAFT